MVRSTVTAGVGAGIVLLLVGLGAYVITDFASMTALIPAVVGVLFILAGVVGRDPRYARTATYAVLALAFLAILGALMGLPEVIALVKGDAVESPTRAASQAAMIVVGVAVLLVATRNLLAERQSP